MMCMRILQNTQANQTHIKKHRFPLDFDVWDLSEVTLICEYIDIGVIWYLYCAILETSMLKIGFNV